MSFSKTNVINILRPAKILKDGLKDGIDFLFLGVGVYVEIGVAGQHGGEAGALSVVEDVDGLVEFLGEGEFIANAKGSCGAFRNNNVGFLEPTGILEVDVLVNVFSYMDVLWCGTFLLAQRQISHVFCKHLAAKFLLNIGDYPFIESRISSSAPYGSGKVYFFHLITG